MTPSKDLAQRGLQAYTKLQDLALHEKSTVLQIAAALWQAEAKSVELAQLAQAQNAIMNTAAPPIADEHFRA